MNDLEIPFQRVSLSMVHLFLYRKNCGTKTPFLFFTLSDNSLKGKAFQ